MKIVTINIPEAMIEKMKAFVGEDKLFSSRSELVRVAVRDFLKSEIESAKKAGRFGQTDPEPDDFDDENYVRIPIEVKGDGDEPITELRTFKILKEIKPEQPKKEPIFDPPKKATRPKHLIRIDKHDLLGNMLVSHLNERGRVEQSELERLLGVSDTYFRNIFLRVNDKKPKLIKKLKSSYRGTPIYYEVNRVILKTLI